MSKSSIQNFNHLKIHSQYSICEGALKIDDLQDFSKLNKIRSLGLCDTLNLCGALEFSEKISKIGTQPIIGTQINFRYNDTTGLLPLFALNEIGYKIFEIYGYEDPDFLKEKFSSKGGFFSWLGILFTAGFTPLPFKLLTISSGFINFNILFFIIICVITRGLRFFLVSYLSYKYGEKFGPFLEKKGAKWSIIISILILVIIGITYFLLN